VIEQSDLNNRFTYHPPRDNQVGSYVQVRNAGKVLAELINQLAPDSREKSLAITRVEEAVMWANAAIARNDDE
jgi:hypothetical protein